MAQEFEVGKAPWETGNAPNEFPVGAAPWEQEARQPEVVDEIHPELTGLKGLKVRTVYKAFGTDPEASFNYLQKEYPNLNWKKSQSGDVLVKSPTEAQWRKLDPSGLDVRDITDVAWDIPAGVAQGLATAGAGIAGAVGSPYALGMGAIPAAMAASGGSGAALEGARQSIGKYFMPEQEFSGTDMLIAGGTGAVSPLLFGTGGVAGQGLKEGVKSSVQSAQRGLVGRGYDATVGFVGPKIGELVSGEKAQVISKAAGMLDKLKLADKNPEVVTSGLKSAVQEVPQKLKAMTKDAGEIMNQARDVIDNAAMGGPGIVPFGTKVKPQGTIPTASFIQPFEELAQRLSESSVKTEGQMADLSALKKVLEEEFKGLPENITAAQAQRIGDRFRERAKQFGMNYQKSGSTVSTTSGSAIDQQIASAFEASRRNTKQAIIDRLEQIAPEFKDQYDEASETYGYLKDLAKSSESKFKNPKALRDTLTRATRDDIEAQNLLDLEQATGVKISDLATEQAAFKSFSKPSFDIRSLGGVTSTTRSIPLALAGGTAGYYAGQQSGGEYSPYLMAAMGGLLGSKLGSPAALRSYMSANQAMRQAPQSLGRAYQVAPYTLMNMSRDENK